MDANIKDLIGRKIVQLELDKPYQKTYGLVFTLDDGSEYVMGHEQDCCEEVILEDHQDGELDALRNATVLDVEVVKDLQWDGELDDREQYTFYKFKTDKGYTTLRWVGSDNGYYSVDVDFWRVDK